MSISSDSEHQSVSVSDYTDKSERWIFFPSSSYFQGFGLTFVRNEKMLN